MKFKRFIEIGILLLSFGAAFSAVAGGPAGYENAPNNLFSIRINNLDVLTDKILPEIILKNHLNNEELPDRNLYHTEKLGYKVSVDLQDITLGLPDATKNHIDGDFASGDRFLVNLKLPNIFATTNVTISLVPLNSWEPKIVKKFALKVTGFTAAGSITLAAQDGDLVGTNYDVTQTEVSKVDIADLGFLKIILDQWVSLTDACRQATQENSRAVCKTFDDYLTLKANTFLTSVVKDQLMGSMKDSLIEKLNAEASASFDLKQLNLDFALQLQNFHTENTGEDGSGVFVWQIFTKSTAPIKPCAANLPVPKDPGIEFRWPAETHGAIEVSLSGTFMEQVLYHVASQGLICGDVQGKIIGLFPYEIDSGPDGPISVDIGGETNAVSAAIKLPMSLNIHSLPNDFLPIHTVNGGFTANMSFSPAVGKDQVSLKLASSYASDIQGNLDVVILPIPLEALKGEIDSALKSLLQSQVSDLGFIHREIEINQFMKARVQEGLHVQDGRLLIGIDLVPGQTIQ